MNRAIKDKNNASVNSSKIEALFFNKKYLTSYIWGQLSVEKEYLNYASVTLFIENLDNLKRPLNTLFEREEKVSLYSLKLLESLHSGWFHVRWILKNEPNRDKLYLSEIVDLNTILSFFDNKRFKEGLRTKPIVLSDTSYTPKSKFVYDDVEKDLNKIWDNSSINELDKSIELFLYMVKNQLFYVGNERTAILVASFNLINKGVASGIQIEPNINDKKLHNLIISYQEGKSNEIINFLKTECIEYTPSFKNSKIYLELLKEFKRGYLN